ncbi:MAG: twin-arginine translocation pathway signal protein [Sphingopyxis macrogoltabida]|uniref:Twin-arginine translocation pathway signal protein n=1 Tax=Sphingopyxis macrogoltabida TaxID=33050 RepID=A0A2W5L5J2_SPHMC|nr:MAG: twin-arginine translocation pathway signal protein [Sphingopyxis macrogoltabida]
MTISRRNILASTVALGALLRFETASLFATETSAKPNILFIMADDLGYADVSCYGRREYQTPAIDSLARDGMRFTHGYANSSVCSPTRAALITGRYQARLPVGLEEALATADIGLPPEHPTLPSLLRKQGYQTALVGKWHLGQLPKYDPLKSGYDHFWGLRSGGVDYFRHVNGRGVRDLWDGDVRAEETGYLTDLMGDRAIGTIKSFAANGAPFFLSLHFTAPHWPWEGPDDQAESERIAQDKGPRALFHNDGGSLKTYAAMVTRMDYQIGRVLAALKDAGLDRNTIVIFTSDNGGERFSDTWPFSGKKSELLEGGLRVPTIVRWPARVAPGVTSDQAVITMDWLPTLLAAAGGAPDPEFPPDGQSILDVLTGQPAGPRTLFWRYRNHGQEACRDGDFKYLKIRGNSFLFNVVDDPLERANLKDRMPEKYAALKTLYDDWNATMLPLDPNAASGGFTGAMMADHFGVD